MASRNEWERWNNDSHAPKWRAEHVDKNGGQFVKTGKGWDWVASAPKKKTTVVKPVFKKTKKTKGE